MQSGTKFTKDYVKSSFYFPKFISSPHNFHLHCASKNCWL